MREACDRTTGQRARMFLCADETARLRNAQRLLWPYLDSSGRVEVWPYCCLRPKALLEMPGINACGIKILSEVRILVRLNLHGFARLLYRAGLPVAACHLSGAAPRARSVW